MSAPRDVEPPTRSMADWTWSAAKMGLLLVLLAGAVGGFAYGANKFFTSTSRFGIETVQVDGARRFTDEQLLRLAGIQRGDNLFALDLRAAEQKLTQDPWIETAQLSRKLPDKLGIIVTEHVPAALAVLDSTLYLVTRDGKPIKSWQEGDTVDFPVVTGVSAESLQADRERALERIASGIDLLRRYERLPLAKSHPVQEVNVAEDGAVSFVVGSAGVTFHLGKGAYRQKMLMAARVLGRMRARGQTPAILFLDNEAHPERVVVRMR